MKKTNVQVESNTSKVKTAGIFFGGVATGGIFGAIGMHLYHKKKALDEMEKAIISNDVPLNDSDDIEQKNSDFCEVPEPEYQEPEKPSVQEPAEEVPEESQEPEPVQKQEVQEEIKDPAKGGENDEISDCTIGEGSLEETSEIRNEPDIKVTEQETGPEVQEVQSEKTTTAQVVTVSSKIVQKVLEYMNDEAQNIYDVVAYAIMIIVDNPKTLSKDNKIELLSILRKGDADMESRELVSFVYQFYNETVSCSLIDSISVCTALYDANMMQKRTSSFPEHKLIEVMMKYAFDAAELFVDTVTTTNACENVISILNYVVDKDMMSLEEFRRIAEMLKKLSCFIYKQKANGKASRALMRHYKDLVEASGIKYTDVYYDDIYPVINDEDPSLQVLMTDCGEVINKRLVNDFATKNGASEIAIGCIQAFPETIENIEKMVSENKYGEAKETYRDMILPVLSDEVIVRQYPELQTIIRNIGDRINDMFIHSLNERFKKERVRREKKQAAEELTDSEDSSIEEEEVKTNTGKTYPAKSKSKNRRRNNGRRK